MSVGPGELHARRVGPARAAPSRYPTSLRPIGEPLIGRELELARARVLLGDETRLLSITGPGGVGKTRFAAEVAAHDRRDGDRAVVYVPLASVIDHDLVMVSIARAAGLQTTDAHDDAYDVAQIVAESFARQPVLLVLDNLEQIVDIAPQLGALLADCPTLCIITTTRVALRIHGEVELTLEPLAVPQQDASNETDVGPVESVAMLRQAVRRFDPGFGIDTRNAAAVAEICRRVEGLPLAIELAAARLRLLTPDDLADLLGQRLDVLGSNLRDAPPHQRTMRATIDWSYTLLTDADQRVLRTLSVFAGGFDAAAVAAVTGDDLAVVLDRLDQLVGHHLVRVGTGTDGTRRFDLFDSIREFAAERLSAAGEETIARQAHSRWVRDVVEEAAVRLVGADQADALVRLDNEIDNIRAALTWLATTGRGGDNDLRIATAMWRYWWIRGRLTEGMSTLDAVIGAVHRPPDERVAAAYQAAASLADEQADSAAAEVLLERALEIYTALGDVIQIANCWNSMGLAARELGDLERSEMLHLDALEVFVEHGDRRNESVALSALATVAYVRGDFRTAASRTHRVIDNSRDSGDRRSVGQMLSNLGMILLADGDTGGAVECHDEAVAIARELDDTHGAANALTNLGEALLAANETESADARFVEAVDLYRQMEQPRRAAHAVAARGRCADRIGDRGPAGELWLQALAMYADCGVTSGVATCLEHIAESASAAGMFDSASALSAAASAMREREGSMPLLDLDSRAAGWSIDEAVRAAGECVENLQSMPGPSELDVRAPLAARLGLTLRELDVVDHLIRRHTDREIAEALFISTRTVTTHVSAILRKLEVSSRRDVAAAVERLGYDAPS